MSLASMIPVPLVFAWTAFKTKGKCLQVSFLPCSDKCVALGKKQNGVLMLFHSLAFASENFVTDFAAVLTSGS